MVPEIFISITSGKQRLIIDGPLFLFHKFFLTLIDRSATQDLPLEPPTPPMGVMS